MRSSVTRARAKAAAAVRAAVRAATLAGPPGTPIVRREPPAPTPARMSRAAANAAPDTATRRNPAEAAAVGNQDLRPLTRCPAVGRAPRFFLVPIGMRR